MSSQVYFGNATYQTWIKAPASGMQAGSVNWSSNGTTLDGRGFVRRSKGSHREFGMSWIGSLDNVSGSLQIVKDFADGLYGAGPFFWNDPYAVKQNILPPHFAAPALAESGWPALSTTITPTYTAATVANGFPPKYATYTTTGASASTRKVTIIIPQGYTFHFGWHGPASGSTTGIRLVPYLRSTGLADTALNPAKITVGGTSPTNQTVSGTTYSHVEIYFAVSSASTVRITAMMGQILPDGVSVANSGFISGKGTTDLDFAGSPTMEYYSANVNDGQVCMAVTCILAG